MFDKLYLLDEIGASCILAVLDDCKEAAKHDPRREDWLPGDIALAERIIREAERTRDQIIDDL